MHRSLTGMVGSVKNYLAVHQKKTDYRPEDMGVPQQTEACHKVVTYVMECRRVLDQSLDGKNLEVVLLEFGIRLQRVIFEHIQQFVISENGVLELSDVCLSVCLFTFICICCFLFHSVFVV